MQKIILASGSPRRKEILKLLGLDFEVAESFYDEDKIVTDDPVELVEELAIQKAYTVAERYPDAIIIGGDTTVYLPSQTGAKGIILGKATNKKQAKEIFGKLVGETHYVYTGVAVVNSLTNECFVGHEEGIVTFRKVMDGELERYVDNDKNWKGFAGAYALQGGAAPFALSQSGKLSAIIGLPVELLVQLLEQAGVMIEIDPEQLEISLHSEHVGIGINND